MENTPLQEQEFEAPNEQNGERLGFQRYAIGMHAASISSTPSGTRQRSSFRTAIHSRQVPSSKGAYVWLSSPIRNDLTSNGFQSGSVRDYPLRPGGSAMDAGTTQHAGYAISQRKRKRIEEWKSASGG